MTVRAKLEITAITNEIGGGQIVKFETRYDESIPEDTRFMKATPWGSFEMRVDNPSALAQFKLGGKYYVDFSPAE